MANEKKTDIDPVNATSGTQAPAVTPVVGTPAAGIQVPPKDGVISTDPGPEAHQPQEPHTPVVELIKMVRDDDSDGPIEADVHPNEVENFKAKGWERK